MVAVMSRIPFGPTNIAKLIAALASHMVAPLNPLYHELAGLALPIMQASFEKQNLLFVALSFVECQQTPCAILRLASIADHEALDCSQGALAGLFRTEFYLWIVHHLHLFQVLVVPSLYVSRELFKEFCVDVQMAVAAFLRTEDFLKILNFIDSVVVQARLAEVECVLAVAHR